MKNTMIIFKLVTAISLVLFLSSTSSFAAQTKYENFNWKSPNGWEGGIFDVPTWFAKDMKYTGREVIRFHEGFYDAASNGFWTYAFALLVDQTSVPTTNELIDETHHYFTGLARGLGDKQNKNYPANKIIVTTKSDWIVKDNGKRRSQLFELTIFDSFTTGKAIKLNAKITTWLCSDNHRAIHYSLSPQNRSHPLWNELNKEVNALKCG